MLRLNIIFILIIFFSTPSISQAFLPTILEPQQPYEALAIDADIESTHTYLGELKDNPHLFEVSLPEPKKFFAVISQNDSDVNTIPFSFIIVRKNDNDGGVTEVGRIKSGEMVWSDKYDYGLGFSLSMSQPLIYELTPGVYRFEISSALNQGKYLLRIGDKSDNSSYSDKLESIRMIQRFFEKSSLHIVISSMVLYPIGSLILLIMIWLTWRYQSKKKVNA